MYSGVRLFIHLYASAASTIFGLLSAISVVFGRYQCFLSEVPVVK